MARIVFYPRRISYSFFIDLAHKDRVEVSVPDDKIRIVNNNLVKIDSSVMKEIGIFDKNATCKEDWSFWNNDVYIRGRKYMREVEITLTGE